MEDCSGFPTTLLWQSQSISRSSPLMERSETCSHGRSYLKHTRDVQCLKRCKSTFGQDTYSLDSHLANTTWHPDLIWTWERCCSHQAHRISARLQICTRWPLEASSRLWALCEGSLCWPWPKAVHCIALQGIVMVMCEITYNVRWSMIADLASNWTCAQVRWAWMPSYSRDELLHDCRRFASQSSPPFLQAVLEFKYDNLQTATRSVSQWVKCQMCSEAHYCAVPTINLA